MTISNGKFNGKFSVKNLYITGKDPSGEAQLYIAPKTYSNNNGTIISRDIEINSTKNSNRTCINANNLYLKSSNTSKLLAKKAVVIESYSNTIPPSNNTKWGDISENYKQNTKHSIIMDSSGIKIDSNSDLNLKAKNNININTTNINIDSVNDLKIDSKKPMIITTSGKDISGYKSDINIKPNGNLNLETDSSGKIIVNSSMFNIKTQSIFWYENFNKKLLFFLIIVNNDQTK